MADTAKWLEECAATWQQIRVNVDPDARGAEEVARVYLTLAAAYRALPELGGRLMLAEDRLVRAGGRPSKESQSAIELARAVLTQADKLHEAHEQKEEVSCGN